MRARDATLKDETVLEGFSRRLRTGWYLQRASYVFWHNMLRACSGVRNSVSQCGIHLILL